MGSNASGFCDPQQVVSCCDNPQPTQCHASHPKKFKGLHQAQIQKDRHEKETLRLARHKDVFEMNGTALHQAAANGDEHQVRHSLEQGALVDALDDKNRTPFIMACK
eukprot:3941723-Rhodomonas_salina.1